MKEGKKQSKVVPYLISCLTGRLASCPTRSPPPPPTALVEKFILLLVKEGSSLLARAGRRRKGEVGKLHRLHKPALLLLVIPKYTVGICSLVVYVVLCGVK